MLFGFSEGLKHLPYPNFSEQELPSVSELCSSCGISLRNSQYLHFVSVIAFCFYNVFCTVFVVALEFSSRKDLHIF